MCGVDTSLAREPPWPVRLKRVAHWAPALVVFASATTAVFWRSRMGAMSGTPMPGGWMMSMTWAPVCGETWAGAAAAFLVMWTVMMAAMMSPVLAPMLLSYRSALGAGVGGMHAGLLTALAGLGYLIAWGLCGLGVFGVGALLASCERASPALSCATPVIAGAVVLIAGALQFSAWKAHRLACCRAAPGPLQPTPSSGFIRGLRLGLDCCLCCAGPMAALFALGIMDLRAMAAVTVAIAAERLSPHGERMARIAGAIAIAAGLAMIAQAATTA